MKIFDSHCHLDDRCFEPDFQAMLDRAERAGVQRMLIAGIDRHTSQKAVALANRHPGIYAAVGVHPHDARSCTESALMQMADMAARESRVVAWGEIGLDFNRMYSPRDDQEKWLIRQLQIADRLNLPLIFHERDSRGRLLEILKAHPADRRSAVVHCFSGAEAELVQYLEMGFCIGITGIITVKKRGAALRRMVPAIPAERLLVETDAPYLTPTPQRNKHRRNEPAFVRQVLLKVAEIREEDPEDFSKTVWANTCRLFRIDPA
jgi:TatD DNase family protein